MAHKKYKRFWLAYGVLGGFGVGISITRYSINIDLVFFYVAIEY